MVLYMRFQQRNGQKEALVLVCIQVSNGRVHDPVHAVPWEFDRSIVVVIEHEVIGIRGVLD
jgi:hypothetical protein